MDNLRKIMRIIVFTGLVLNCLGYGMNRRELVPIGIGFIIFASVLGLAAWCIEILGRK